MKTIKVLLFIITVFLMSCRQSYDDHVLRKMSKINPNLELGIPFLGYQDTLCEVVHYYYVDTTSAKYLKFGIRYHMDIQQYFLDHYILSWREGDFEYVYSLASKNQFKFDKIDLSSHSRLPYSEYYKRRHIPEKMGGFSKNEIIYYDLHKDSLDQIIGENLPSLPKPTRAEKKAWKRLYGKK